MTVHRALGPGLTADAYVECLAIELRELEMDFVRSVPLELDYRGRRIATATRLDFIISSTVLLLVRSQDSISRQEVLQLETLLRHTRLKTALLVNFNVAALRKGIHQLTMKRREA